MQNKRGVQSDYFCVVSHITTLCLFIYLHAYCVTSVLKSLTHSVCFAGACVAKR